MPYMNVAPLEKAAKDAAAKVKECEKDVTAKKKALEDVKKKANEKPAYVIAAEKKLAQATEEINKAQKMRIEGPITREKKDKIWSEARAKGDAVKKDCEAMTKKWGDEKKAAETKAKTAISDAEKS